MAFFHLYGKLYEVKRWVYMFLSTVHSFENLNKLKESGIDGIIIGVPYFSIRHCIEVSFDDLGTWKQKCDILGLGLYINVLKMCMEEDLEKLHEFLILCKQLDIDGIYYSDEGVLFEAMSLGMESKLIYQPETLVTSSNDVQFYLSQGIQAVSLAHELSLHEIELIACKCRNLEILVSGYFSIMYSRRPLITNYLNAIESDYDFKEKRLDLIEQTRNGRMPIIQDDAGTHVFSEEPISSFQEFERLKKCISRFRIDSLFFDDEYTCQVVQAYKNGSDLDLGSNRWYHEQTAKKKEEL